MADGRYLGNSFLVAMPSLEDENFNHSVTLLCEHNDKGALGLIVNRPTDLKLSEMLSHMGLEPGVLTSRDVKVFWGGPVQPERGFVIHRPPGGWESTLQVSDELYITTSRDILVALTKGEGPREFFVTLGYAGWAAGQLENEILGNSWLNTPVDGAILFTTAPSDRWLAATKLIGLDVAQLSGQSGHA